MKLGFGFGMVPDVWCQSKEGQISTHDNPEAMELPHQSQHIGHKVIKKSRSKISQSALLLCIEEEIEFKDQKDSAPYS